MPRSRTAASMHFMRMPMYGAAVPSCTPRRRAGPRGRRPRPPRRRRSVAVLEVDAQVLDRLALQLGAHAVVDGAGELAGEAEDGGEGGRVGGVLVERRQRLVAPGAEGVRGEGVGGHVDGVDGLAGAGVSG